MLILILMIYKSNKEECEFMEKYDQMRSLKYDYDGNLIHDGLLNYKNYDETPEEREKRRQEDLKIGEEIQRRKKEQNQQDYEETLEKLRLERVKLLEEENKLLREQVKLLQMKVDKD